MRRFFEKLKDSLAYQFGFFLVSMAVIFTAYFLCVNKLEDKMDLDREVIEDIWMASEIMYSAEENILSGWVLKNGVTMQKSKLILYDVVTGEKEVFALENYESEKAQEYFRQKASYGKAGFEGKIDFKKTEQDSCYEIIYALSYKQNDQRSGKLNCSSGKYLYGNKLYSYNPLEFSEPEFVDDTMQEVVEHGEVKLYSEEQGIYIYQYKDMFYYIATDDFPFAKEGKTHISYHVRTSCNELLPEERQQYEFDNLDFRFENNELKFSTEENYRVAVAAVPSGYPVISIYFAIYDDATRTAIWGDYFR